MVELNREGDISGSLPISNYACNSDKTLLEF